MISRRLLTIAFLMLLDRTALAGCGSDVPVQVAPSDHAELSASPVEFEWTAVPGAERYRVWVIEDALDVDVVGETVETKLSTRLGPGAYGWFVEALSSDCPPARSRVSVFELLEAGNCPVLAPQPVAPAAGDGVTSPVTFSWTPVPGAIAYEVSAALESGESVFVAETSGTSLTAHLAEGNVRWSVEAEFSGCAETESVETSFVIRGVPGCDNRAPLPMAPAFGATALPERVEFLWTAVPGANRYRVLLLTDGNDDVRTLGTTTEPRLAADVPAGPAAWTVVAEFDSCPPVSSPASPFAVAPRGDCAAPGRPEVSVQPRAFAGDVYDVVWSAVRDAAAYEIDESESADFASSRTIIRNGIRAEFSHPVSGESRYFYRVRPLSACGLGAGPYSRPAAVLVSPRGISPARPVETSALYGRQARVEETIHLPGFTQPVRFSVVPDQTWLTVTPAEGLLPAEGIDLRLSADLGGLPSGTHRSQIRVRFESGKRRGSAHGSGEPVTIPFSVSLVTLVSPEPVSSPPPASLFIPAVVYAGGFRSDIRIANTSAQVEPVMLAFNGFSADGSKVSLQTNVQIEGGETLALDNLLGSFYGLGTDGGETAGLLEIRPLSSRSAPALFAAGRIYGAGPAGTFGEVAAAIPYAAFVGANASPLQLPRFAHSQLQRTTLALVEASGEAATVRVSLFDGSGSRLMERLVEMLPGGFLELDDLAGEGSVEDARIEVAVTSPTGRVTAYASVTDAESGDPTLVLPLIPDRAGASRVMLPGIADVDQGTIAWRSAVRVYNGTTSDREIQLMYIPQGSSEGPALTTVIGAGAVLQLDDVLRTHFGVTGTNGAILLTTPGLPGVAATASTFHRTARGTYGQLIPGLTSSDGAGVGERALQVLQVEESDRFRTNLGLAELTGKPVVVEITAVMAQSKLSVSTEVALAANESRQFGKILQSLGISHAYDARIAVRAISGEGRVGAFASLIDNGTNDPTWIPAQ